MSTAKALGCSEGHPAVSSALPWPCPIAFLRPLQPILRMWPIKRHVRKGCRPVRATSQCPCTSCGCRCSSPTWCWCLRLSPSRSSSMRRTRTCEQASAAGWRGGFGGGVKGLGAREEGGLQPGAGLHLPATCPSEVPLLLGHSPDARSPAPHPLACPCPCAQHVLPEDQERHRVDAHVHRVHRHGHRHPVRWVALKGKGSLHETALQA